MTEDRDVAPITNLFRKVSGVEDEFGFEECVFLVGGQEAQIELQAEITHRLVKESSMTGFITGHVSKTLSQKWISGFDPTAELLVEQKP